MPCNHAHAREGGEEAPAAAGSAGQRGYRRERLPSLHTPADWNRSEYTAARECAPGGGVSVVDRAVAGRTDRAEGRIWIDQDADAVGISCEYDSPMPYWVSTAAALTNWRLWEFILTEERLADSSDFVDLFDDHRQILRGSRCLGHLSDEHETPADYIRALQTARDDLLELTKQWQQGDYDDRDRFRGTITREALGLVGTMVHLLDLVDVDATFEVRIPELSKFDTDHRRTMAHSLAIGLAICSRYGQHTGYRQLFETRDAKLEWTTGSYSRMWSGTTNYQNMFDSLNTEGVSKLFRNPKEAPHLINNQAREYIGKKLNRRFGEQVVERDWDNLIILDGCRYDTFAEEVTFDGDLQSLRSAGSTSYEYFVNNYDGRRYPETAYITANTHFHRIDAEFADIVPVREFLWNENIMTVPPDVLTEYVLNHADRYDNKRLIIHFMQPHMPFLTRTEAGIERHPLSAGSGVHKYSESSENVETDMDAWWLRLEREEITREAAYDAYRTTLQIVLEEIDPLLSGLQGKTVVSADHGNVFGENNLYGHPKYRAHPKLVKVPWFISDDTRKEIQPADRLTSTRSLSAADKDKLRALGYV